MASIEFPLSFKRQFSGPLDESSVYATLSELNDYITNNPSAYDGQILSVSSGTDEGVYINLNGSASKISTTDWQVYEGYQGDVKLKSGGKYFYVEDIPSASFDLNYSFVDVTIYNIGYTDLILTAYDELGSPDTITIPVGDYVKFDLLPSPAPVRYGFIEQERRTCPLVDKYTKAEVDTLINNTITSVDWKEAVTTFSDLSSTYPSPDEGWTASVNDEDVIYRYDGTTWVILANGVVPLASETLDGKLSKEDFTTIQRLDDTVSVYGAGIKDANGIYKRNGVSSDGFYAYALYDTDGVTVKWNLWANSAGGFGTAWQITSEDIDAPITNENYNVVISTVDPNDDYQALTPPENGAWLAANGATSPAPTVNLETVSSHAHSIDEIAGGNLGWDIVLGPDKDLDEQGIFVTDKKILVIHDSLNPSGYVVPNGTYTAIYNLSNTILKILNSGAISFYEIPAGTLVTDLVVSPGGPGNITVGNVYDSLNPIQATQVEMEAGTETEVRSMSPENVKQAINNIAEKPDGWKYITSITLLYSPPSAAELTNQSWFIIPHSLNILADLGTSTITVDLGSGYNGSFMVFNLSPYNIVFESGTSVTIKPGDYADVFGVVGGMNTNFKRPLYKEATQAEMEDGTETEVRSMSPENVKQAIDVATSRLDDTVSVYGAGIKDANGIYVRNGVSADGFYAYTLYGTDGVTAKWNLWANSAGGFGTQWQITSEDIDVPPITNENYNVVISTVDPNDDYQALTPPENSAWLAANGATSPAPTVNLETVAPHSHSFDEITGANLGWDNVIGGDVDLSDIHNNFSPNETTLILAPNINDAGFVPSIFVENGTYPHILNLSNQTFVITNSGAISTFNIPAGAWVRDLVVGDGFNGITAGNIRNELNPTQATQAEMEDGTETEVRSMSPANIKQATTDNIRKISLSGTYPILESDDYILCDDDAAGNIIDLTLPSPASVGAGWSVSIKKLGTTSGVSVIANPNTLDGSIGFTLTSQYETITVVTDGANWFKF